MNQLLSTACRFVTGVLIFTSGLFISVIPAGAAPIFTLLHQFGDGTVTHDGATPFAALVQGDDGDFYGTTEFGGLGATPGTDFTGNGTVFKITPSGALTTLYEFTPVNGKNKNSEGANPIVGLAVGSDGNFYGTTFDGGANGVGTVYQITPEGNLSAIHTFSAMNGSGDNADGAYPTAIVQGSDGSLYGTTRGGGTANQGVVYKITLASSAPAITSFSPMSGPVGTVVTIIGTHLNGVTAVRFHQASAKAFAANAAGTQLTVTVPAGAATGTVTVTTPSGSVKTTTPFKVTP